METTPDYVEGGTKDPRNTKDEKKAEPYLKPDAKDGKPAGPATGDPAGPAP